MTDYTTLSNTAVGVGGLPSGATVTALRDNPIAIAEGSAGAPRVLDAALDTTVTAAGTSWVLNRNAASAYASVGTLAFMLYTTASVGITSGSNYAGSALKPASLRSSSSTTSGTIGYSAPTVGVSTGTWKALGAGGASAGEYQVSLFLRIA